MNIRDKMELSALLGNPVEDFYKRSNKFTDAVHKLVRRHTSGPREAVLMLALAYMYHIKLGTDGDLIEESKNTLDCAAEFLVLLMEDE